MLKNKTKIKLIGLNSLKNCYLDRSEFVHIRTIQGNNYISDLKNALLE